MTAQVSRRQFLKLSAAALGGAAVATNAAKPRGVTGASSGVDPAAVPSMLIDISRCVGCGNCQRSCIEANNLHPTTENMGKLQAENFTFLQKVELEGGKTRYVKRQCMHCLDAACASACPVSALHQTPEGPDRLPAGPLPGLPLLHGELPVQRPDLRVGQRPDARDPQVHVLHRPPARGQGPGLRLQLPVRRAEVRHARRVAEGSPGSHRGRQRALRRSCLRRARSRRHGDALHLGRAVRAARLPHGRDDP